MIFRCAASDARSSTSNNAVSVARSRPRRRNNQSIAASSSTSPRRCARWRNTSRRASSSSGDNATRVHCDKRERRSGNVNANDPAPPARHTTRSCPHCRARLWKSNNATSSSRIAGDRFEPVERDQRRPSKRFERIAQAPAAVFSGRYAARAPGRFRGRARSQQHMGLADARGPGDEQPVAARRLPQRAHLRERAFGRADEGFEALVRRIAQGQRQLRRGHAIRCGRRSRRRRVPAPASTYGIQHRCRAGRP